MKLNFIISKQLLIVQLLSNTSLPKDEYRKDIVDFQNYAWEKSSQYYNVIGNRVSNEENYSFR